MGIVREAEQKVQWPELAEASILLVDDDGDAAHLMSRALTRAGCRSVITADTAPEALRLYREHRPDLIVMDLNLPQADGIRLMERMRASEPSAIEVPVLMVTGDRSEAAKREALARGVSDFLNKTADTTEFVLRVRNLLHLNGLRHEIERHRASLEETVRLRTLELNAARREVLERLAIAAEYRDDATQRHTKRVGDLSAKIAEALGMPDEYVTQIRDAALLHDLGKIGIPDAILLKPGPLTDKEFEKVKLHAEIGAHILDGCNEPLMVMAREIAWTHHERWDGAGYPRRLDHGDIPICGRIVAVADAFDAITHERPYKAAMLVPEAIAAIEADSGSHFDPKVVAAFLSVQSGSANTCQLRVT